MDVHLVSGGALDQVGSPAGTLAFTRSTRRRRPAIFACHIRSRVGFSRISRQQK